MRYEEEVAIESRIRQECATIASMESAYWAEIDSDESPLRDIVIGAMGASANIVAAILMERTSKEYAEDIKSRDEKAPR